MDNAGTGDNEDKQTPTKINTLENIAAIATGYSHSLALTQNGEVYSWGLGTNGQLGNGAEENSNVPVKVDGLTDIIKIDAYKNRSIALSKDGKAYVWGEGFSTLPMKVIFSEKVVDISGNLILTEKGKVYSVDDTSSPISSLSDIAQISCGENHNLALDTNGIAFSWGNNQYGECGKQETGTVTNYIVATNIMNIEAGNGVSILQDINGKVYVLGNNANGQIGLEATSKAYDITEITLSEDVAIERISAGEGTHSGLIDENGFVWHTGTNSNGELGTGDTTNQTKFIKTGDSIITIDNKDKIYLDLEESVTIFSKLENTFNLKIDLIDDNQNNFKFEVSNTEVLNLQNKTLIAKSYGTSIVTITHIPTGRTKQIQLSVVMKMESIVQGFRDADLADGKYEILVKDQVYSIELYNHYDDVTYSLDEGQTSKTVSLGNDTPDETMLVVKYHKNLTIEEGVTLTPTVRKKGMYLCVLGDIYNHGNITMTARGAKAEGENVYLWKNIDDTYEYVPANGGEGGIGVSMTQGYAGGNGTNRATGGGGAGGSNGTKAKKGGNGSAGTSYSGGSGGGGAYHCAGTGTYAGGDAEPNGGAGGTGSARTNSSSNKTYASGGAGNSAGKGAYVTSSGNAYGNAGTFAEEGTGGLLLMYTNILYNEGSISSNGSNVNGARYSSTTRYSGGGASGAGSINIFANFVNVKGTTSVTGGKSTVVKGKMKYAGAGSNGGNGSLTINELGSVLNYPKKKLTLNYPETYSIDKTKLSYTKLNEIQTEDLTVGNIIYEMAGGESVTVDSTGKITPQKLGTAKVKITDTTNGYSTYIIVEVISEHTKAQLKEGTNFTVALKENGTVWTYGLNNNGQLGNNTKVDSNEPIQVLDNNGLGIENIVDIGAGNTSAIALTSSGEVYTWGTYTYLAQEGETSTVTKTEERLVATKEESLSNIVQVDCYGNNFYAIDLEGQVYIWGEGYTKPTKIETEGKMADIAGGLLLGENGRTYKIENPKQPLPYLSNICEIAKGDDHYLFVSLDGYVYSLGKGDLGQLGNGQTAEKTVPVLVKTQEGYLQNVISVSAGSKASIALTIDGKVYVWGDNTNQKLGVEGSKLTYATPITKVQDREGKELTLNKIENIETGKNHSSLSDEYGFVYSVGLNNNGQLGTADTKARTIFTRIGKLEITTNPKELNIPVHTTQNISIALSNSFNLKTDIAQATNLKIKNTNEKELSIEEIAGANNNDVINIKEFRPNYKMTGNKIGRVCVVATSEEGYNKNIWVNVVDSSNTDDKAPVAAAKVVNGNEFTISLRSDGSVWSFGTNENGQLGLGDTNNRNNPEKLEVPEEIVDISSGASHTLLLGKSGTVYSFGLNKNGQLGTGNVSTYKLPTKINLTNIQKVVAKQNTSFAITSEGKVYAWGSGYSKKPTLLSLQKTVQITTNENGVEETTETKVDLNVIDIGTTYYLSDDGIVRKLADNTEIKLSLNEYAPSEEPVYVQEEIVQMSEGLDHLLLLAKSGRVYSYGKNVYGQLGDGSTNARETGITTVVRIEDGTILENIVEIAAGEQYGIAVSKDGKIYTFGINRYQQLGFSSEIETGGIQESGYAILKEDINNVERVTAGYSHTAVYKEDGNVYTWGKGESGELGNGEYFNYYKPQLVGKNIIQTNKNQILLEEEQTFDLDAYINYFNLFTEKKAEMTYEILDGDLALVNSQTGEIMAMKEGRTTLIVREVGSSKIAVVPVRILAKGTKPDNMSILVEPQVATSGSHTVTLKVDGTVWCYGKGTYGELGTGEEEISDEPVKAIFPEGTIIVQIAAGENHSMALDSDGNVWTWGRNQYYQLGNTKDANILTPTKVAGLSNIQKIACGTNNSFAIGEEGEIYSFGLNANGEGGIRSYTNKIGVTKVTNITDAIDIKAGKNHTILLKSTGEVYVTGSNLYGELGNNNSSIRKVNQFTKVESLDTIVGIAAGDSHNIALKLDGSIYTWGSNIYRELGINSNSTSVAKPTKVANLSNIRYVSGGKGYSLALNKANAVYGVGLNTTGELGNNNKVNQTSYTKLSTIQNVIDLSAGNTYTVMLKADGTVWGTGDYAHGDEEVKSKTKGIVPIQVGNDETGFEQTEITVKVGESKNIVANCAYAFNLIHLDDNFAESLNYTSLKEEIATVDELGVVTGNRIGTTRVHAVSKVDQKVYSILVKVIGKDNLVAPKVEAGENYAAVLKADGSIWTFGYNGDGTLATGNYITKDVPTKTNILATYDDLKAGKNFMIALRSDGTVWSVGNNKQGQLGDGTTKGKNKLSQIQTLKDITKIAAGKDFALAIDNYGIVYEWGAGTAKPTMSQKVTQRVIDIAARENQSAFVTAKGTVIGYGDILNGEIAGVQNAIKVAITKDKLVILTSDYEVYEYQNGRLNKLAIPEQVIDIAANNTSVMYQTVNEKAYVSGQNTDGELGVGTTNTVTTPSIVNLHGENIYGIGVGYHNTYIIENTGNVYAAGENTYGSIGNGTRENELEHILIGDRKFEIEPITATMKVGDIEKIEVTGNAFNVFGSSKMSNAEYNWTSDEKTIVTVTEGTLTALAEGTAHITVTDKVTGETLELTRIILPQEKDRIAKITVNGETAILDETATQNDLVYKVQVVTNENTAILNVTTNNLTDRISIDDGNTWSYNGTLNQEIALSELPNKLTELTITVGIQNNNGEYPVEETYTLIVERITNDIGIKQITATSKNSEGVESTITATPVSLTRYEVVVEENTDISLVDVLANCEYSYISIDGKEYSLKEQNKEITIGDELTKEVKIVVKSEAGKEAEYTLVIYTQKTVADLVSLTVGEVVEKQVIGTKDATKVSEGVYAVTLPKEAQKAHIEAAVASNLVQVSIAGNTYKPKEDALNLSLESDTTIVTIKTKTSEGTIKEYTLYIYREKETDIDDSLKLDMLMINGTTITPEDDGLTYIAYLPSAEQEAIIRAIAKQNTTKVKIAENEAEVGESTKTVSANETENTYTITLSDETGKTIDYTVIIRKAEADTSLDKIEVNSGDNQYEVIAKDKKNYTVKIPKGVENVDVTAITGYAKAKVQVNNTGNYVEQKDTQNIAITEEKTQVSIKVQSENGLQEAEYILTIETMSQNTNLMKVTVDGNEANLAEDGKYHYTLTEAANEVLVSAITEEVAPNKAWVNIDNSQYALYEITKQVDITAKQTEVGIKVKAEDGTIKEYTLVIEGLPDDTNIAKVTVNGKEASYVEGKNRYEIRSQDTEYNIEVTLSDLLASMVLADKPKAIGKDKITVTKTGEETLVKVVVTSQNGLETQEYTIAIMEQSNNTNLDILKVNGNIINPDINGNYYATITNKDSNIHVEAIAEDTYAITTITLEDNSSSSGSSYIADITQKVVEGKTIYEYTITVVAENGASKNYKLQVEQLESNHNILNVLVGKEETNLEEATLQADGTYYYKIDRVEEGYAQVNLESEKSTVEINGEIATVETESGITAKVVKVSLPEEKNEITLGVIAQDGTTKEYKLVIEKKSNDVGIKSITGTGVISTDIQEEVIDVYVDEDLNSVELTTTLNNALASLKLEEEENYEPEKMTRAIDLSSYAVDGVVTKIIDVQAEDGTTKQYTINIYKQADLDLASVVINNETITYDTENEKYETLVANGNKPEIVITASNPLQTVQLLDLEGNVLATKTGSITTTQTLSTTELTNKYIIKVISHNGEDYGTAEYDLIINQKSTETGITYVKVDGLGTIVSSDKLTYSSIVSGKESYPVEIKLKDEKAKVQVQDLDGNVLIENQTGTLTGSLKLPDGETKQFNVIVTSENGETKTYTLSIERISSNLEIESIQVTDYDTDGASLITKNVVNYDAATKTYKIVVNKNLPSSTVTIKATSIFTTIVLDNSTTGKGNVSIEKTLNGLGITKITMKLTAADGSEDTKYLELVQLSDEIGIQTVEVDGTQIEANEAGDYETTVTDANDLSNIKVTLLSETSKVSINGNEETLQVNETNVSKGTNRQLVIPIKVTAEDGTNYTYTLTLNIISSNADVQEVNVNAEASKASSEVPGGLDGKYVAYIDKYATEANVEVIAKSKYATITYEKQAQSDTEGTQEPEIVSGKGTLNFSLNTEDLSQNSFTTTFKVTAEDGTTKTYEVECIRKDDNTSIANVYINDEEVQPNSQNPDYADGTYYKAVVGSTAKVKVVANSSLSTVSFAGKTGVQALEQIITLDTKNKVTLVPVTITSQQGSTYETVIYLEKISDNNELVSVKVQGQEAETAEQENTFFGYIYDTLETAKVEIEAKEENATIIRTVENGDPWLDDNGLGAKDKKKLTMNIPTQEEVTIIYFKIVAEDGSQSPIYTLRIEKMSTDNTLKEIYVDGKLIEPDENGKYIASVLDTQNTPEVKAVTNHELAHVRIALGDEHLQVAKQNVTLTSYKQTTVPITVRSQSGLTKVTYLYINKISTDVKLAQVTLDDKAPNYYNQQTHTYTFLVDKDKEEFELFALAASDYTTLVYEEAEYEASLKTIVSLGSTQEGKSYKIVAKSESGITQEYTINIVHTSDNANLSYLKVDDIERTPDEVGGDTYTVAISETATSVVFELQTQYSYATIRLGDNTVVRNYEKGVLDCSDLSLKQIVVPIVVTAADGETVKTYQVVLVRKPGTYLSGKIVTENVKGEYISNVTVYKVTENIGNTESNTGTNDGSQTGDEAINNNTSFIGSDGRIRTKYAETLTNQDGTFKILMCDPGQETSEMLNAIYEVVVTKDGYLSYTVTDIQITEEEETILDEYHLIAGNVITQQKTANGSTSEGTTDNITRVEEIEIDDLVALNDKYGITVSHENGVNDKNAKFDFNEDGAIDKLDRDILKKNYSKKAETVKWVNPNTKDTALSEKSATLSLRSANAIVKEKSTTSTNGEVEAQDFIIPLNCKYVITSNYGYREGPITKTNEKHTGIDISGTHHAEVLAAASGEVTFAGVQNGYGNCIEIKHIVNGKTLYSFYAHLSKINVKAGQKVEQGTIIALEGGDPETDPNPGSSTGHHLHFEIRTKSGYGNDVDPTKYIKF